MTLKRFIDLPAHWRVPATMAIAVFIAILLLFHETTWSIVEIWLRSETYNHGFLILPISLWLLWEKRAYLAPLTPRPAMLVLPLFIGSALLWGMAYLVGVQVVAQFALVAMLLSAIWVVLGHQVTKSMGFPLLFLFLAVPMGQGLVPPMMEFTATFTVTMLQLTGIPVFREGLFFSLPSGDWSVVEACSGVRYIIASVTLGLLYAYLSYNSLWKRLLFVLIALLVPVLANGLRAYMIVMIGHLSGMKLAVGVDHLIYGWVFFGLVMLLLFWIGSFWSEEGVKPATVASKDNERLPLQGWAPPLLILLVTSFGIQSGVDSIASREQAAAKPLALPQSGNGWAALETAPWSWRAAVRGEAQSQLMFYEKSGQRVAVFIALYPSQRQGHEAVSSFNSVIDPKKRDWRILHRSDESAQIGNQHFAVNGYDVAINQSGKSVGSRVVELKLWQWYQLGERRTADPYLAKLFEAINRFHPGYLDGAYIAIAAEKNWNSPSTSPVLQQFVTDMMPKIHQAIAVSLGRG